METVAVTQDMSKPQGARQATTVIENSSRTIGSASQGRDMMQFSPNHNDYEVETCIKTNLLLEPPQ